MKNTITFKLPDDLECAFLGEMGQSTKAIVEGTGLTPCQVNYRLHKAGIKRSEFRNGRSEIAQKLISLARTPLKPGLDKSLVARFAQSFAPQKKK